LPIWTGRKEHLPQVLELKSQTWLFSKQYGHENTEGLLPPWPLLNWVCGSFTWLNAKEPKKIQMIRKDPAWQSYYHI
jgi:hypothetical protein